MSDATAPLFPVPLATGEPGSIFVKANVALGGDTPDVVLGTDTLTAHIGPFATHADAQQILDRLTARPLARAAQIVSEVPTDPKALDTYYPVDDAFLANPDIANALLNALHQRRAAELTGNYEQWRNRPEAARAHATGA